MFENVINEFTEQYEFLNKIFLLLMRIILN